MTKKPLVLISLGAGVQSSTVALMVARGDLPMVDGAIFADTGAEPKAVMDWLDWLEKQLPFPVYRVMEKDGLKASIIAGVNGGRFAGAPFFTESPNGRGILRRQCTREFKITPITRKARELVGLAKGQRAPKEILAELWIGISWDEMQRMKEPQDHWIRHRWPLIEKRMTRGHCLEWMQANDYPQPPRSACTFCPYHSNEEWRRMRDSDPESWNEALHIDALIRNGLRGGKEKIYLHSDLVPLAEADLADKHKDQGQLFTMMDECDGMCGV